VSASAGALVHNEQTVRPLPECGCTGTLGANTQALPMTMMRGKIQLDW